MRIAGVLTTDSVTFLANKPMLSKSIVVEPMQPTAMLFPRFFDTKKEVV